MLNAYGKQSCLDCQAQRAWLHCTAQRAICDYRATNGNDGSSLYLCGKGACRVMKSKRHKFWNLRMFHYSMIGILGLYKLGDFGWSRLRHELATLCIHVIAASSPAHSYPKVVIPLL